MGMPCAYNIIAEIFILYIVNTMASSHSTQVPQHVRQTQRAPIPTHTNTQTSKSHADKDIKCCPTTPPGLMSVT